MKVYIFDTAEGATAHVAGMIVRQLAAKPDSVLGLATGGTMVPVYRRLVEATRSVPGLFRRATTFNLDEYVGLSPDHSCSYWRYMNEALFDRVGIDRANVHLPRGDVADPDAEAERYDRLIGAVGGIDLQLLGVGRNGHIGFNEPTSSLRSRTRVKTLTESTRQANRVNFDSLEATPSRAITVGIETILEARSCIVLATGDAKAQAIAAMVEGAVTAFWPASALQFHPKTAVVIDNAAAVELAMTEYYRFVHPVSGDQSRG